MHAANGHMTPGSAEQVEMDAKRKKAAELHINTVPLWNRRRPSEARRGRDMFGDIGGEFVLDHEVTLSVSFRQFYSP